jgi:intracellular sulfur oxidation DsrE/DsrF family protein
LAPEQAVQTGTGAKLEGKTPNPVLSDADQDTEEPAMNLRPLTAGCLVALLSFGPSQPAFSEESAEAWEKIVFHVDEMSNARWALMLARSYLDDSPKARIVFVVYGPGMDFLLEDTRDKRGNPYDPEVLKLVERGVTFRACATTLSAREIDREDLLDGVEVVPSGITEIARLQIKEGFAYLKP